MYQTIACLMKNNCVQCISIKESWLVIEGLYHSFVGSKDCSVRKSYLDQCMSGDQVAFRFHACSDSEDSQDTFLATLVMQNVEKPCKNFQNHEINIEPW